LGNLISQPDLPIKITNCTAKCVLRLARFAEPKNGFSMLNKLGLLGHFACFSVENE